MHGFGFFHRAEEFQPVSAGQVIFQEDQPGDVMYVLIEGEVHITMHGKRINHLRPGDIFGEMALIERGPRSATATAVTDGLVLPVNRQQFTELLREYPDFALWVMDYMSVRSRRMMAEEVKLLHLEDELRIGREIQLSLLPQQCPVIPGWEFAAFYRPARMVGGDLYDFIPLPQNPAQLNIVIADVTGKGVPAALFMALSRTILRVESTYNYTPAEVLRRVNHFIIHDSRNPLFLSIALANLDTTTGQLTFANGGHDRPLWLRQETGTVQTLTAVGMLLGAFPDVRLADHEIHVAPGDVVVFYTDGITEAQNDRGEFFGIDCLHDVVLAHRGASAGQLLEGVVTAVTEFTGATPQADDLTLVIIKRSLTNGQLPS
ncbi:MAG: SpoIIE family protein phosphatase [Anaerolineae bacterium]|nr:SpoIIE family protein phosphatase [Anaerolineae bacterium]